MCKPAAQAVSACYFCKAATSPTQNPGCTCVWVHPTPVGLLGSVDKASPSADLTCMANAHLLGGSPGSSPGVQVSATRTAQARARSPHTHYVPRTPGPALAGSSRQLGRVSSFVSREQLMPYSKGNPHQTKARSDLCLLLGDPPTPCPQGHRLYLCPSLSDTCRHPGLHHTADIEPQCLTLMTLQSLRQGVGSFHVAGWTAVRWGGQEGRRKPSRGWEVNKTCSR